jgi:HK97 family phage major capsid protein
MPNSIYPGLRQRGGSFTFGRNGVVTLPTRSATPTIAGSFIAQGAPIPVRQGAFSSISLTPKKMAVISTFTREIALHSTPDIEKMIRQAILEDTAVAIDTVLLDNAAATTTRPAGLVNGISTITPAGTTFANMVTDLKALVNVLISGTKGNVRAPVWLMSPVDVLAIRLAVNTNGEFPFAAEVSAGTLLGYPIIASTTMTADTIMILDAADFITATGDVPDFNISDTATIHMEDTTPLAIGTFATPNTVAAPVRSLWQTDCIGVRMIMDINWALRRTGVIGLLTSPTWN